jgi:hypothetical protein
MRLPRRPYSWWVPEEWRPKSGSLLWRLGTAVACAVFMMVVLNMMVFSWVKLPHWASVLISVISALIVGVLVFITGRKPTQEWWAAQRAYYETPEWQAKRLRVLQRDGHRCCQCGARAEQVHHLSYRADHNEPDEQLVSLCTGCHEKAHGRRLQSFGG